MLTKSDLLNRIVAILGGRAAEEVFLNEISTGAQNDLEKATALARAMVTEYGMSERLGHITLGHRHTEQVFLGRDISRDRNYSETVAAVVDEEIKRILDESYLRAIELLRENHEIVERIVAALYKYEVLDAEQFKQLMRGELLEGMEGFNTPIEEEGNHQASGEEQPGGE